MAVKKGILENFLKPNSQYKDNQKNLRAIFIDKNEDELKKESSNFLENKLLNSSGTQKDHNENTTQTHKDSKTDTIGSHLEHKFSLSIPDKSINYLQNSENQEHCKDTTGTHLEHESNTNQEHIKDTTLEFSPHLNIKIKSSLEHNKNTLALQVSDNSADYQKEHNKDTNSENILGHTKNTSRIHKEQLKNTYRTPVNNKDNLKNTIRTPFEHANEHTLEHNTNTIRAPLEHIITQNSLTYLTGIQKQLLFFFYQSSKKTRSNLTEEFAIVNLADALEIKEGSIKNSLRRLEEKGFIKCVAFKKGRGGWTKFELPDPIYRELLETEKEHNRNTIGAQLEHVRNTYKDTEKNTSPPSSSSILNKNIITTTELSEEWNFDLSNFEKIGFNKSHVKQLVASGKITPQEVEQSLTEFVYDYENNFLPTIKTSKINLLMGLFRSGLTYTSENYRTEQEQLIKMMAERTEKRKKQLIEEKLLAWIGEITDEELKKLENEMPSTLMVTYKTKGIYDPEIKNWIQYEYLKRQNN